MRKRFDVKPASANNDRQLSSRMNLINRPRGDAPKFFRAHIFVKRHCADQMMRRLCARRLIRLRSQKIETAINLKRIGVDNLSIDVVCEIGRDF